MLDFIEEPWRLVDEPLACPGCHSRLLQRENALRCSKCNALHWTVAGIPDFTGNQHYDRYDPSRDALTTELLSGLQNEVEGSRRRIAECYAPLLRRRAPWATRVLDVGCGNGVSVDTLTELGFDAWGIDSSELRRHQWGERTHRDRLATADALRLPFPSGFFDVIISSGVIEHIGVVESSRPYTVRPLPDQRALRERYLRELTRVARTGGRIFIDAPNGNFPFDFWHGDVPGGARRHRRDEAFLPTIGELRALSERVSAAEMIVHSPYRRFRFRQAAAGRMRWMREPANALFRLMNVPGLRWLAQSRCNPFLIVEIERT